MNQLKKKSFVRTFAGRTGIISIALVVANLFFVQKISAQIISAQTGNWNATTTWVGGVVPTAASAVQIRGGFTVTVNVTNAACASLKIGGDNANNNSGLLAFATTGNPVLTVSGNVQVGGDGNNVRTGTITFQSGSTLTAGSITLGSALGTPAPGTIIMTAGGTLNVGGAITVNTVTGNTWTPGTGTVNLTATSTLPTTIFTSFSNLQINNSAVVTFPTAKAITNNLSIGSGSSVNLSTVTTHSAGTLTLGGTGTVNGSWGSTTSTATNKNNVFFAATTGIINVTTSTCTPPGAPTVSSPVTYCAGAIALPLTATGSNLLWYTQPSGGVGSLTAPTPSTAAAGTTPYYVSQTVGCEGPRALINVVINSNPVSTVNGSTNITCFGANDGTITILATGGTGPYSYSVNDGLQYTPSGTNPYIFPGLSPNTPYKIRVKDSNGCQSQTF